MPLWCALLWWVLLLPVGALSQGEGGLLEDTPLTLRIPLKLILAGGNNNELVDTKLLQQLLKDTLSQRTPYCIDTQEQMHIVTELNYVAEHNQVLLSRYEYLLGEALGRATVDSTGTYIVQVSQEMKNLFLQEAEQQQEHYTMFILYPSKQRLRQLSGKNINDNFQYNLLYGSGTAGQTWISEARHVVVDLAAGPSIYGSTSLTEGLVSEHSIPRLEDKQWTPGELTAHLVALITSAVRHVFVSDVQFLDIHRADKVLIPIIVLRNHDQFNPLNAETGESIDVGLIRNEIRKLFLPTQEVSIIGGLHSLHEHRHLSILVAKARRAYTYHDLNMDGQYVMKMEYYLDSQMLLHGLRNAEDLLASALLSLSSTHTQAFFNPKLPDMRLPGKDSASKSQGTLILPVYVFSLVDSDETLLFDHHSTMAAYEVLKSLLIFNRSPHCVVVLQTNASSVPVPYFANGKRIHLNPKKTTQQIIAGIAKALGGIVDPAYRFSPPRNSIVADFTWSLGYSVPQYHLMIADTIHSGISPKIVLCLRYMLMQCCEIWLFPECTLPLPPSKRPLTSSTALQM